MSTPATTGLPRSDDHSGSGPALGSIRRDALAGYLLLLLALIAGSTSRRVGDGGEYLDMALDLARFEAPSVWAHFWFYSALAAPILWLVRLTALAPQVAFTALNVILLVVAFWVASGVLRWPARLLIFVSPMIWWVDKPHTEVFTFSLLTIALIALGTPRAGSRVLHPGWAVVCLAAAGTQNPPFLALVPLAMLLIVLTKRASLRDGRFIGLCLAALFLAVLHPGYYYVVRGRPIPLSGTTHGQVPNIDELTAVVRDTNLGLIANAPAFTFAVVLAVAFLIVRSPRRILGIDTAFSLCAGALFLASFAQTTNYNHGGTPGMSRYAVWLIPLALPFFRRLPAARPSRLEERSIALVAAVSCAWNLVAFHPKWPESSLRPTGVASWLWENYPAFDRPLPEVFVERTSGSSARWWVPAFTPDCGKVLLTGRGEGVLNWPFPCFPTPVPPQCTKGGVLCYANREGSTYSFSVVPRPSFWAYRFEKQSVWTADESKTVGALLQRLRWWEMGLCHASPVRIARGEFGVGGVPHYCASDRLLAYIKEPAQGMKLPLRLRGPMSGAFVDASTGQGLAVVTYGGKPGELWQLEVPSAASVVLVLMQTR